MPNPLGSELIVSPLYWMLDRYCPVVLGQGALLYWLSGSRLAADHETFLPDDLTGQEPTDNNNSGRGNSFSWSIFQYEERG